MFFCGFLVNRPCAERQLVCAVYYSQQPHGVRFTHAEAARRHAIPLPAIAGEITVGGGRHETYGRMFKA